MWLDRAMPTNPAHLLLTIPSPAGPPPDVGGWYHHEIIEPGKQPLLLLLAALICTFLVIRLSTRMIRRQVRWWPGNIIYGDVHVHHVVIGTCAMVASGIGGFAANGASPTLELCAVLFGMGTGLVLDEFALIFHLQDVYWAEAGRKSIDAVILATVTTFLLLLGFSPLGLNQIEGSHALLRWLFVGYALVALALSTVCFLKGKMWTGVLGMLAPPVTLPIAFIGPIVITGPLALPIVLIGAVRLAKPSSPWARWCYPSASKRMARSLARAQRHHCRWTIRKHRLWDLIGGAPYPAEVWESPR